MAFYDAGVQSDVAVMELGDDTPKQIARGLAKAVQESATIEDDRPAYPARSSTG